MALECMALVYMTLIGASVLTLAIGSYLYLVASSKCIKGSLFAIGQCTSIKTYRNIREQLVEFIEFHSLVKQLSEKNIQNAKAHSGALFVDTIHDFFLQIAAQFFQIVSIFIHASVRLESGHNLRCFIVGSNTIS